MGVFYALAPTPGSYTLTLTLGGARANRRLAVVTHTGVSAFQDADTLGQLAAATTTDAVTTASMTPTSQPAMLSAVSFTADGTATYSAGTGHTSRGVLSNWDAIGSFSSLLEDIRLTSTSAVSGLFTIGTSRDTLSSGMVFTETPTGTFASTLADTTAALSGAVTIPGSFASTLADTTAAFQGAVTNAGAFASTLADTVAAFSGAVGNAVTGTLSALLEDLAAAFVGAIPVSGTFAATLGDTTASFAGAVSGGGGGAVALFRRRRGWM